MLPPLTHLLAETAPTWAKSVAPWAERSATLLAAKTGGEAPALPTPLTGTNRRSGRGLPSKEEKRSVTRPPAACRQCGLVLEDAARLYCDNCLPQRRDGAVAVFASAGLAALARRRAEGSDPAHGGEAGRAKGLRNAAHSAANAAWEVEHGNGWVPNEFRRDILPMLQGAPLRAIAAATGLSLRYCSLIRRGEEVPHGRHWLTLQQPGMQLEKTSKA